MNQDVSTPSQNLCCLLLRHLLSHLLHLLLCHCGLMWSVVISLWLHHCVVVVFFFGVWSNFNKLYYCHCVTLGNRLDETRGFPDELSPPNTRCNPTWLATEWRDTTPLHGTTHRWEAGSVESSSMVWTCIMNERFLPAETASMGRTSSLLALSL